MTDAINTPWNLSDFDTAGWKALEPRAGARVVKVYGIGCGEAFGRLVRQETTRWGTHWIVAMDDGTTDTFHGTYTGRAIARPFIPDPGCPGHEDPVLCHETRGIGCYVVRVANDAHALLLG